MVAGLNADDYSRHNNIWAGPEIIGIFAVEFGLNRDQLQVYTEHLKTVIKDNDDIAGLFGTRSIDNNKTEVSYDDSNMKLSASTAKVMKSLINVLKYMYEGDAMNANFFKVFIEPEKNSRNHTLNIYCLNAAVGFKEIGEKAQSILLASGTLSPLDSFAGELGLDFPVRIEAPHVIDLKKQVFIAAVSSLDGVKFNSSFNKKDDTEYQNALGRMMVQISLSTPGGTLVFLPSYVFLDKLYSRWDEMGYLNSLGDSGIKMFVEPKEKKDLEGILSSFYSVVDKEGGQAVFLAVLRGKLSEGINFSDHYARSVIIVGIPYPAAKELKVTLKKDFQNTAKQNNSVF
jgi:Fanconi anemia group J protein